MVNQQKVRTIRRRFPATTRDGLPFEILADPDITPETKRALTAVAQACVKEMTDPVRGFLDGFRADGNDVRITFAAKKRQETGKGKAADACDVNQPSPGENRHG